MKIKILGKTWDVVFRPEIEMGRRAGECDSPSVIGKEIRILDSLIGSDVADTFIHECLHASAYEVFKEEFVNTLAEDIARGLMSEEVLARIFQDPKVQEIYKRCVVGNSGEDRRQGASPAARPAPAGETDQQGPALHPE